MTDNAEGHWILQKEHPIIYWFYPIRTRRVFRRGTKYIANTMTDGSFSIFGFDQVWYNTRTREKELRTVWNNTIEQFVADNPDVALYDKGNDRYITADGAMD